MPAKTKKVKKGQKVFIAPSFSSTQMRELKEQSQLLKPIVIIGDAGLTEAVIAEIERALYDHELIKIRLAYNDSDLRTKITANICDTTCSTLIQNIGHVITIYRKNAEE